MRTSYIERNTKETKIKLELNLDGGEVDIKTGVGFFDHMLNAFAHHGGFGLKLICDGDLHVDCHHTVEDCGIVLGKAFDMALKDKAGIKRFASAFIPMDEALGFCAVDVSGRDYLVFNAEFPQERIGDYDSCMTEEFMRAFASNAKITLHLRSEYGKNSHHITEALFKAFAYAMKEAVKLNESGKVVSTKGVI
ncbi:MAG: imidazoleglycerol-phosphate dehydratase HisB [Ruminococcaceae bacterium]|nr:imidazoleglycerol-phosphate dehydratase HisB [Oscillospiraceae bacterium]